VSANAISELDFLKKLQRLLDEGEFTATYKFALLNALADVSVEREPLWDGSLRVSVESLAEKFIEYYWPQARPYRNDAEVLYQNTGKQAAVISALSDQLRQFVTITRAQSAPGWRALVSSVAGTIRDQPLWKLQTIGADSDEFLYRRAEFQSDYIRLLPGVPASFRTLYGLVLHAVRGAWVRQIVRIGRNRRLIRDSDLESFLFGSERTSLKDFVPVLRSHQEGVCLYCDRRIENNADVDHFIAWSRYPTDLGHNLVLSHPRCNRNKRDYLAHPRHLEAWYESHVERGAELAERLDERLLPHDIERTCSIAWWAYEQGASAGAHVWLGGRSFADLDPRWKRVLEDGGRQRVAEKMPDPNSRPMS
jgi:5-methylcytosine-specific restriction endonuclease McrA